MQNNDVKLSSVKLCFNKIPNITSKKYSKVMLQVDFKSSIDINHPGYKEYWF